MADKKYDGVIEAVHYSPEGRVEWVRAYLRRGPTWGDRVILPRQELVEAIQSGKRMMIGKRVEFLAGTFDVTAPVLLTGPSGKEFLTSMAGAGECDNLEGAPLL